MKLSPSRTHFAFTLTEVMLALAISSVILGAILTSSASLQKSFNAIDAYFGTHMQQIRIVDYLSRDVKRGLIVTTSADLQTVTITVPNYIIQAGDPEAVIDPTRVGTPRTPTMAYTPSGWQVNYGPATTTVVYSISGLSILRTEYAKTSITFQPIFTSGGVPASRSGTTVYSTAYLRNKRRG
jgi:prepilin-type N-terminal cleavage/methylation domain-containing protein